MRHILRSLRTAHFMFKPVPLAAAPFFDFQYNLRNYGSCKPTPVHSYKPSTASCCGGDEPGGDKPSGDKRNYAKCVAGILGTSLALFAGYKMLQASKRDNGQKSAISDAKSDSAIVAPVISSRDTGELGAIVSGLPVYTMEDIAKHTTKATRVWCSYKNGVYDITDFVDIHPGGGSIMACAGRPLDEYWEVYPVHFQEYIYDLLEKYRIGNFQGDPNAQGVPYKGNTYEDTIVRDKLMVPILTKPWNGGARYDILGQSYITPNELFYVRSHLEVPELEEATHKVLVEIEGESKTFIFRMEEFEQFPKHSLMCTLMCTGNRRSEMHAMKQVKAVTWQAFGVSNATWSGYWLRDVLEHCGITEADADKYQHVHFRGMDHDASGGSFGVSIPFWKAMDPKRDVLIATEMNGEPLPPDHGFPIRMIIPGSAGVRSCKWLSKIVLSKRECDAYWQSREYKAFGPNVTMETADFENTPAVQDLPVNSAVCSPMADEKVKLQDGKLKVNGYAYSGNGQKINRVDVTVDGGKNWYEAELEKQETVEPPRHWVWTMWSINIPVDPDVKNLEIWVKAVDSCYNSQPETIDHIWNVRGILCNAYHRVPVTIIE